MAIIQGHAMQSSSRGFYPKTLNGSLRFNDDDSAYLSWTPTADQDNANKLTYSLWVKRGNLGLTSYAGLISAVNSGDVAGLSFHNDDSLIFSIDDGNVGWARTNRLFRDTSAWYHIVVAVDTTLATASDRIKIWVNGERETFSSQTNPTQNYSFVDFFKNGVEQRIGVEVNKSVYSDCYMAEVHGIDGTAYDADAFGEFKNGVWVAKTPEVTYGTNGFYLNFQDDTEVEAFNTVLYRGDGTENRSITGTGFTPDLVWIKNRTSAYDHMLYDSIRGAGEFLESNTTDAEASGTHMNSFDSDGFTVSFASSTRVNQTNNDYVAWCWKAGDSNVSNTDGTITSTVRANPDYGFSIVSYTGTGSAVEIGHGLDSAPEVTIIKRRDATTNWVVYTDIIDGSFDYLFLNTTAAKADTTSFSADSDTFNFSASSTVANVSGADAIAYCFHSVEGYSKFGTYTGTGATGNTVTTGFKPGLVIIKKNATASWYMFDNTRDVVNDVTLGLFPDLSAAEVDSSTYAIEFTDTGFTVNGTNAGINTNTATYIYAAFADTREAAFWLDQSGNDNDWQPENLDHNDTVADSPTDNFATWNPVAKVGTVALPTFSDGNLTLTTNASVDTMAVATMGITSGTFYYEATLRSANTYHQFGVASRTDKVTTSTDRVTYFGFNGYIYNNATSTSGYGTNSAGDVLGVACDADAGTVKFYLNNTLLSTESWTSNTGLYIPFMAGSNGTYTADVNFGQQPFVYGPPE